MLCKMLSGFRSFLLPILPLRLLFIYRTMAYYLRVLSAGAAWSRFNNCPGGMIIGCPIDSWY